MTSFSLAKYLPLETASTTALIFSLLVLPPTQLVSEPMTTVAMAILASLVTLVLDGLVLKKMTTIPRKEAIKVPVPSLALLLPAAIATAYIGIVLFGAPITTHHIETLALASYLTIMTCTPVIMVYGTSWSCYQTVLGADKMRDQVDRALYYPAFGSIIGCWLGAIPIPLEWDRPWQRWPITCVLGVLLGRTLGIMVAIIVCIDHDDDPVPRPHQKKQE